MLKNAIHQFFKNWGHNIAKYFDYTFNRIAIIFSVLSFVGLELKNSEYSWYSLYALGSILILLVLIATPKLSRLPNLASKLDISLINTILSDTPRAGLVGLENAGKSTFIDAAISRKSENKQTEKPYAQFINVPDTDPAKSIIILDSVGGRSHVQFHIQSVSRSVAFFFDHADTISEAKFDTDRARRHSELAEQLIHSARDGGIVVDHLFIVANKSDLWQSDENSVREMETLATSLAEKFQKGLAFRNVKTLSPHSNESRVDVSALLKELAGSL